MRGKLTDKKLRMIPFRITPAYAGKTKLGLTVNVVYKDHPRVCGENPCSTWDILGRIGSPPRMRGKLKFDKKKAAEHRITPAYAGKT